MPAFAEIDGLFVIADGMALGAADAAIEARRIEEITITTASFSRESVPYLRKGYIDLNVDESPVLIGRTAISLAVRLLNGEEIPRRVFVPNPEVTVDSVNEFKDDHWAPTDWTIPR